MPFHLPLIAKTVDFVRGKLEGEGSGHDWWHIYRVWQLAKKIGSEEKANMEIVELGALLHDIADWKFHEGDTMVGPRIARQFLESQGCDSAIVNEVCDIVEHISFKGAGVETPMGSLEGKVVQDADRLEALGAMGIARTFAYGGHKGREIYNPQIKPQLHQTFEQYKKGGVTTINHFYEKLLLLKVRMNTNAGKRMAEGRHTYMEQFLNKFYNEWNGKE